jgi:hypothetical protein
MLRLAFVGREAGEAILLAFSVSYFFLSGAGRPDPALLAGLEVSLREFFRYRKSGGKGISFASLRLLLDKTRHPPAAPVFAEA